MDFAILLHPEVVILAVLLALLGALLGFALGNGLQARRGAEALEAANHTHTQSIADLEADNEESLKRMREGHAEELERLQTRHSEELESARQALESARKEFEAELTRVNNEHAAQVERINEANNTNVRELRSEHDAAQRALQEKHAEEIKSIREETERTLQAFREEQNRATEALRAEHQTTLQSVKADHAEATAAMQRAQDEMRERLETDHQRQQSELRERIRELEAAKEKLGEENHGLQDTIRELNESINEAKRNNTFSLSKSGDRLIRVIRSVQDLAQELDETSRAVSDGEYSVFDAIQDQRDRDMMLKLTEGQHSSEHAAESQEKPVPPADDEPNLGQEGDRP